jgi:type IV secretory pathway VirB9-like protein
MILLFILTLALAELFPARSTLQLNLKGESSDPVYTLNCHTDFYTFIELKREEIVDKVTISKSDEWEIGQDNRFTWIRPRNEAGVDGNLSILTKSGKMYVFILKIIDDEELFYPKVFVTGDE